VNGNTQVEQQKLTDMEKELLEMKKQLQKLAKNGGTPQPSKKVPKVVSKPGNNQFKINTTMIHKLLSEATKENLAQLIDIWPDLLSMLSVTQRAIMKASTPVAASPNGLIVSFEYDILCQKATNDNELLEAISENLKRLVGYSPQMICVPAEQWPIIREQFLKLNKELLKKPSVEKSTSPAVVKGETQGVSDFEQENLASLETALPEPDEDETIVIEAMELFGEKNVEVKND
jgi:DNA polymerase-3 subunit gamma/tau